MWRLSLLTFTYRGGRYVRRVRCSNGACAVPCTDVRYHERCMCGFMCESFAVSVYGAVYGERLLAEIKAQVEFWCYVDTG